MNPVKFYICGIAGALITGLIGGWDGAMLTLCIFMFADYITGLTVAGVFHRSPKSNSGGLESKAGLRGLCRKGAMLLLVIVAWRLDIMAGLDGVLRSGTIYALMLNEAISIIENVGLMGVPLPKALRNAIEQLKHNDGDPR